MCGECRRMKKKGIATLLLLFALSGTSCEGTVSDEKARATIAPKPPHRIRHIAKEEYTPLLDEKEFFRLAGEIYGYAGRSADEGIISEKQADELRTMCASYNQCAEKYEEVFGRFIDGAVRKFDAEALLSYSIIFEEKQ